MPLPKLDIILDEKNTLKISPRKSSFIKKAVIEKFLPRFANDSEVLYVADKSNRALQIDEVNLNKLNFYNIQYDELPDIIAYSRKKNWLYLIETVHSYEPMSEERVFELKKLLKDCKADLIFVTAFTSRNDFRKWILDIAWETEVWTADNPDHLVHFNGDKFFGPYN